MNSNQELLDLVERLGVDLVGVADLSRVKERAVGEGGDPLGVAGKFRFAIVLGAQLHKLGRKATGADADLFLERAAIAISGYLEGKNDRALIIHPEDEFDPVNRLGLLSLKVLAKEAGLGWQGRSLLIVSPEFGPVHRWIALLTNMELRADEPVANQCGNCSLCVDQCPSAALKFVSFTDHPGRREDVLDIQACRGDDSCQVCLDVCPWLKQQSE